MEKEQDCVKSLSEWIIQFKKKTYSKYVKTNDNINELQEYRDALEVMEKQVRKAVYLENVSELIRLGWPSDLMECIKDMAIRCELMDLLYESFAIHHFNKSPVHEKELHDENNGLR